MNKRPNVTHMPLSESIKIAEEGLMVEMKRINREIEDARNRHKIEMDALELQQSNMSDASIVMAMITMLAERNYDDDTNE